MVKWVSFFEEQDETHVPRKSAVLIFDTEEEAMNHFYNSLYTRSLYHWWSYPEKVSDEEAERLKKEIGVW